MENEVAVVDEPGKQPITSERYVRLDKEKRKCWWRNTTPRQAAMLLEVLSEYARAEAVIVAEQTAKIREAGGLEAFVGRMDE